MKKCMKCGGSTKTKMAKGGVIAKEKVNIYGIPQENMGTSGQYGKMQKGGSHPGFKKVQSSIAAKQGISKEAAGAILASSTRKASPAAKKANPRLKRVK